MCGRRLKISLGTFICSDIKENLVPRILGQKKLRQVEHIRPKVIPGNLRCLICGTSLGDQYDISSCSIDCGFKCHVICLKSLQNAQQNLKHQLVIDSCNWACNDITMWIDFPTVTKISNIEHHNQI